MGGTGEMTALACPKCGSTLTRFELTPDTVHHGKTICGDCGAFIKWEGKPKVNGLDKWTFPDAASGDYILAFGKHTGKTIRDLLYEEMGYIEWIVYKADFSDKCPEFVELIKEIAAEEGVVIE